MADAKAFGTSCWNTFVTWFFGGLGATLGYLLMNWIWKKLVG